MSKFKPLLFGVILSSILLSAAESAEADRNKLPEIGSAGASILSIDKERLIGNAMMKQLRASQPVIHDPILNEYINELGNVLVKNAQDVNYGFKFFIINNDELNAFAFFGGHVGIHSGLITTADTESELASVLAHEVSHVTQRHLARRIEAQSNNQPLTIAGMVSGLLLSLINPSLGMAALSTTMAASQQSSINYSRGNEKEADRVGITLLADSGFDPMGAPNFFQKMAEKYRYKSKPPAMLLTHPLPESRISDARLRAQRYKNGQTPPNLSFELAKARIQARYQHDPASNIAQFKADLKKLNYSYKVAAQYGLAISYFEDKQYAKAQNMLETMLNDDANNLFYADVLTDTYIATEQYDKAITMLSALNDLMPNNQVVALNYANALQEAKEYQLAELILEDFLLVKPNHFIAYDLLVTVYRKQKKMALMHYAKAELLALRGIYQKAIDELQTGYTFAKDQPLIKKRIKARILQFQDQEEKLKRL